MLGIQKSLSPSFCSEGALVKRKITTHIKFSQDKRCYRKQARAERGGNVGRSTEIRIQTECPSGKIL